MTSACTPCGRVYKSLRALQQHLRDSPAHPGNYDCKDCDRLCDPEDAFNQHLRDSPAHAANYDCKQCDRSFSTGQALDQHLRDSPAHAANYDCKECNRSFDTEQVLQQHLRDSLNCSKSPRSFDIWPSLYGDLACLLEEDNLLIEFHESDEDHTALQEYDSHVMGRFACKHAACPARGWSSKKIAITVRMYPDARYNVRVYYQSCKICRALACPKLDDSYAGKVAYRLKKRSGTQMEMMSA